jgi:hypothetical protein
VSQPPPWFLGLRPTPPASRWAFGTDAGVYPQWRHRVLLLLTRFLTYLRSPCHPEQSRKTNAIKVALCTESPESVVRDIRPREHAGKVEHTYARHSR